MSFPNENMRPIQYPIDRSQGLEYDVGTSETIDTPFEWSTTDNDERVTITLELSLNEYVALASAIDVGRDIAYGQASLAIWWLWVRSINTMDFCEQVDACIETNPTTQLTINNMLLSLGVVNPDQIEPITPEIPNRFPQSEREEEVSPPPPTCDNDELWAGILEIVVRLNELGLDFLQDVVSYNDKAERIANIIDIVPLFGDIAADIITVFADIAPDLLNGYLAHSSQQVLEDTACALFELVCEDCRYPTYQEIYDHYASAGITGIQDIVSYGITGLMDFLIGSNNLANAVIWYTMNVGVLYTLYLGGTFANRRGIKWLDIWANIGEESPSNAWTVLCDGCDTTCVTVDYTTTDDGYVPFILIHGEAFGVWIDTVGWSWTVRQDSQYCTVKKTLGTTEAAKSMKLTFTCDEAISWPTESVRVELFLLGSIVANAGSGDSYFAGANETTWSGDVTYDEIRLISAAFTPANVVIKSLEICY